MAAARLFGVGRRSGVQNRVGGSRSTQSQRTIVTLESFKWGGCVGLCYEREAFLSLISGDGSKNKIC